MTTQQILFIDSRVTGYETLIAKPRRRDPSGMCWMRSRTAFADRRLLADAPALDAIQIVSRSTRHLVPGSAAPAATCLTMPSSFQSIGARLTATGDLLLYGCNVAQGTRGRRLCMRLPAF